MTWRSLIKNRFPVGLGRVMEKRADALGDDLGVLRDILQDDGLVGMVRRPDLEDLEDRRAMPADPDGDGMGNLQEYLAGTTATPSLPAPVL
jgi:hypothetical protein